MDARRRRSTELVVPLTDGDGRLQISEYATRFGRPRPGFIAFGRSSRKRRGLHPAKHSSSRAVFGHACSRPGRAFA